MGEDKFGGVVLSGLRLKETPDHATEQDRGARICTGPAGIAHGFLSSRSVTWRLGEDPVLTIRVSPPLSFSFLQVKSIKILVSSYACEHSTGGHYVPVFAKHSASPRSYACA